MTVQESNAASMNEYAQIVRFTRAAPAQLPQNESPAIAVWFDGLHSPLAVTQEDAVTLLTSLAGSLAKQRHRIGQKIVRALGRWVVELDEEWHAAEMVRELLANTSSQNEGVKGLVSRERLSSVQAHVSRLENPVDLLVRQVEPQLATYVEAEIVSLAGNRVSMQRGIRALITTVVTSLRAAHYRLWRETVLGSRLAQLDPTLGRPSAGKPPE